MFPLSVNK